MKLTSREQNFKHINCKFKIHNF
uniref:Uncharacterized protein n=1 Tax=Anguilla anguilla TaxID=7936 RepID=A0A0E9QVD5_ANGAN